MNESFINQIVSVLEGVPKIKEVFAYPVGEDQKISRYPAVVVLPQSMDNGMQSTKDNAKEYLYKIWILIGVTAQNDPEAEKSTMNKVWTEALPSTVDAVVSAFDTAWNGGSIGGHRIRYLITNGQADMVKAQDGREAVWELTLSIRLLTNT